VAADQSPPPPTGRPVVTPRSEARERALHLLYEAESRDQSPAEVLADQVLAPDDFTTILVSGIDQNMGTINHLISSLSRGWPLERMPAMDRAVLRLGTYELMCEADIPTAVIIDEAVELAKRYSTEDSGRFVNGVLAAVAADLRSPPTPGACDT
jgi:transcription antitermination protein NusB